MRHSTINQVLLVNVKSRRKITFNITHKHSTSLVFRVCKKKVASKDPNTCPTYTILPSMPNVLFGMPSSFIMMTVHAGRIPISNIMRRLARNWR